MHVTALHINCYDIAFWPVLPFYGQCQIIQTHKVNPQDKIKPWMPICLQCCCLSALNFLWHHFGQQYCCAQLWYKVYRTNDRRVRRVCEFPLPYTNFAFQYIEISDFPWTNFVSHFHAIKTNAQVVSTSGNVLTIGYIVCCRVSCIRKNASTT